MSGKVVLITGAARGQGRAHATRLAEEGADIIAVDLCGPVRGVPYTHATVDDLDHTVKSVERHGRRIVSAVVDVRDQSALRRAVDAAVAELGGLDVIVANAGICIMGPWNEVSEEAFRDTVEVNLFGVWNTLMVGVPHLQSRGGGSVIVVSSAAGLKGVPFASPYAASKHGVVGLARSFAAELAQDNIRVNTLHPGGVDTEMISPAGTARFEKAIATNPRVAGMHSTMLAERATTVEDQSSAVLYLASDESRYMTAASLTVDLGTSQY